MSAGVRCTVVETERGGHAREVVQSLSLAELQSYDGLIAVREPALSLLCSTEEGSFAGC